MPARSRVGLIAAFGLLDHVEDVPRLFADAACYPLSVVASYYAAEDTEGTDRLVPGWHNDLTRNALAAMVRKAGFAFAARRDSTAD